MHQLCVHRDMKHLGSLESTREARVALGTPRATPVHLSCSPNILCTLYLDEHTLMYEPIVNCSSMLLLTEYSLHFPPKSIMMSKV